MKNISIQDDPTSGLDDQGSLIKVNDLSELEKLFHFVTNLDIYISHLIKITNDLGSARGLKVQSFLCSASQGFLE